MKRSETAPSTIIEINKDKEAIAHSSKIPAWSHIVDRVKVGNINAFPVCVFVHVECKHIHVNTVDSLTDHETFGPEHQLGGAICTRLYPFINLKGVVERCDLSNSNCTNCTPDRLEGFLKRSILKGGSAKVIVAN